MTLPELQAKTPAGEWMDMIQKKRAGFHESPSRKPKVVVIGSYNIDLTVQCSSLPAENQTILGSPLQVFGGGRAGNSAISAARAGCDVSLVGRHGRDAFGALARGYLTQEGINLEYFQEISGAQTGVCMCVLPKDTGRSILVITDSANQRLTGAMARDALPAIESADLVIVDTEIAQSITWETVKICAECGVPCLLDVPVADPLPELPEHGLFALVAEEKEAVKAIGAANAEDAIAAIHRKNVKHIVLMDSYRHFRCFDGVCTTELSVPLVKLVDRFGAVETFVVWLGLELLSKKPLVEATRSAAQAMAYSLARIGAHQSIPRKSDVAPGTATAYATTGDGLS